MYLELNSCRPLDPLGGQNKGWIRFSLFSFLDSGELVLEIHGLRFNTADRTFKNVVSFYNRAEGGNYRGRNYVVVGALGDAVKAVLATNIELIVAEMPDHLAEFEQNFGRKPTLKEEQAIWASQKKLIVGRPQALKAQNPSQ